MNAAELPVNEAERLQCLAELGLAGPHDSPEPDAVLDGLVRCAAHMLGYPIAVLSLVGQTRMWFKARHGTDAIDSEREPSFCSHTILGDTLFEVPDAHDDPRFAYNPWVVGATRLRAYAGLPVRLGNLTLGTLCVADTVPRRLTPVQVSLLADMGNAVNAWFRHRREHVDLLASRAHLQRQAELLGRLSSETPGMLFQYRCTPESGPGQLSYIGGQVEQVFGPLAPLETEGLRHFAARVHPSDLPGLLRGMREAAAEQRPWQRLFRVCLAGEDKPVWRSGRASPSRQPDGSVLWHGFIADVDEHIEVERLRRDKQAAEHASAEKSAFLSRASHELRTPLNAMIGFNQLLLLDPEPLSPRQRERVEWALASAHRLHELVDGLLDVQRHDPVPATVPGELDSRAFTLLYIEDEPLNTLLVQEALRQRPDWRVLHAADGTSGLALARTQRPEVVLTDINLPGLSGLDIVREMRGDDALQCTLCIALSADATPGQIERAMQAGFDDYWTKPLDVLELAGRLADALARHGGL